LDLHDGIQLVTDESVTDSSVHSAYIFEQKAEEMIVDHATSYPDTPMFLYYAVQLVHFPYLVPSVYSSRCSSGANSNEMWYCGMNLMLDEVVANLTCTLESTGLMDNTVVVLASDNGGNKFISGNNYPFRGAKYNQFRGGLSTNAFIFSPLLDQSVRGTKYFGQMHVTDWLPTLMYVATEGQWTGSYTDADLDGVSMWEAIMSNSTSPHTQIVHYASLYSTAGSVQIDMVKLDYLQELPDYTTPATIYTGDLHPTYASYLCSDSDADAAMKPVLPRTSSLSDIFSGSKPAETSTSESYVYSSMKSTGDYLLWLFGAGVLVGLLLFMSNHTSKVSKLEIF
jgi:arylsulfatase A-like enzyme